MPERLDYAGLLAGITAIIDRTNSGEAGLHVLDSFLGLAERCLDVKGMTFVELGRAGGRVIAATGAVRWALGRPVQLDESGLVCMLTGPRTQTVRPEALDAELAQLLRGCGLTGMLMARVEIGKTVIGTMHAHYSQDGQASPELHAALAYLAATIAHMYGHQAGLPVHGDGPVVAALTDGLAIVDRDGTVRLWNPAAERLTDRPAIEALGKPLPF
ncbi:MAG TPA: PAS domain-containing protein, partial [Micromonosporaceae bacterium]|nr:PAS domain-containing protein [Micromonosporaceae bacterium]